MAILHSTWLFITLPRLLHSILLYYHGYTSVSFILHYSTMAPLHTTWLYITKNGSTLLYHGSIFSLHYFTMALSLVYITLPWLCLTIRDYPWLCITLTWHYFTLIDSSLFYHGSPDYPWLYITLPWLYFTLLDSILPYYSSTSLDITLPWLYFSLLDSTLLYHGSTSL